MDPDSVPDLIQRFGVRFPAEPLAITSPLPKSIRGAQSTWLRKLGGV